MNNESGSGKNSENAAHSVDDRILKELLFNKLTACLPSGTDVEAIIASINEGLIAKAEQQSRAFNERFTLIARTTNDALFEWDLLTNSIWWSETHYTLFGFDPSLPMPSHEEWFARIHRQSRQPLIDVIEDIRAGILSNWQKEIIYIKPDGTYGTVLGRGFAVRDENQNAVKVVGSFIDITARKNEEVIKTLTSDISSIFNKTMGLRRMLNDVLTLLIDFGGFLVAEAWLVGTEQNKISLMAQSSRSKEIGDIFSGDTGGNCHASGTGLPGVTWKTKSVQFWDQLAERQDYSRRKEAAQIGMTSAYGIPLTQNNETVGVLVLGLGPDTGPENIFPELLQSLSSCIGAEIKRKQLENDLNQIFNSVKDIICIAGADRFLKKVNPAMCDLLEYSEEELLSSRIDKFLHPDEIANSAMRMAHFGKENQTLYFENRYVTRSGKVKWLAWTATKSSEDGLLFCVGKDITEKKENSIQLEESEKRYSRLFHLSPQPMWVYDYETLLFLDVNDAAIKHYGYTNEEFLSMSVRDIRPETDIPKFEEAVRETRKSGQTYYNNTFRHKKKNGEIIIVDIQSNSLRYKGRAAKVVLATDVTERQQYISAIEDQNKKLREISWIQSHVVRAPLTRLMGLIDLLRNYENSETEKQEMLDYILSSAHELDAIITDISEKARN